MGNVTIETAILGPEENEVKLSEKSVTENYEAAFAGNPI